MSIFTESRGGLKAVGSIRIDQVNFAPNSIHPAQHEKAQYTYHSISDFDDTEVSFVRLAKSNSNEILAAAVNKKAPGEHRAKSHEERRLGWEYQDRGTLRRTSAPN